jgi:hypothetical protein
MPMSAMTSGFRRPIIASALGVVVVLLAATGCLTPLTAQRPLTPVSVRANPLVGVLWPVRAALAGGMLLALVSGHAAREHPGTGLTG